mmetsp:Transcript_4496/g.11126  ORF Transcript_4496/g.11126 Transcript_4496/m.11126 type:complete len:260 (-) Transcript_4496:150-929(-)
MQIGGLAGRQWLLLLCGMFAVSYLLFLATVTFFTNQRNESGETVTIHWRAVYAGAVMGVGLWVLVVALLLLVLIMRVVFKWLFDLWEGRELTKFNVQRIVLAAGGKDVVLPQTMKGDDMRPWVDVEVARVWRSLEPRPSMQEVVAPGRYFVREGTLKKDGEALHVFLFNDLMLLTAEEKHLGLETSFWLRTRIFLSPKTVLVEEGETGLTIVLSRNITLHAESAQQRDFWAADIRDLVALSKTKSGGSGGAAGSTQKKE